MGLRALALVPIAFVALLFVSPTTPAHAADTDASVAQSIQDVLNEEYAQASYSEAKKKLIAALDRCAKKVRCGTMTRAQANVALGMVASQAGLADDAGAKLPSTGTSPTIRGQFAEVQKDSKATEAPAAATATESSGGVPEEPVTGGKVPEWLQLAREGLAADKAGKLEECIENDKKALKIEPNQPITALHVSSCEARSGKLIDALKDLREARKLGLGARNQAILDKIAERQRELVQRLAHIAFVAPKGVSNLRVTFDDRPVPGDKLNQQFPVDPGKHTVRADGTSNNVPLSYEEEFEFKEGQTVTARITLTAKDEGGAGGLEKVVRECLKNAKTQEDILSCIGKSSGSRIVIKTGLMNSGYTDTNHVHVYSPEFTASVASPTAGWNVGGGFLVDFVTAASPDIVSEASRAFREQRYAGNLSAGYKPGMFGVQGFGNLSSEPDYVSYTGGLTVTADLNDKLITPSLGFSHSDDTITRQSSPNTAWERRFFVNEVQAALTMVLSSASVLQIGGTFTTERGDQSKPYRFVPMFSRQVAEALPSGATIDLVNRYRLPFRPVEQLPTERDRYAIAARYLHRAKSSTFRLEQRFYRDTWSILSTTTDARYLIDFGKRFRVWPHARLYAQSAASFHRLAYVASVQNTGEIVLPTYRTGDRENGALGTLTLGGGTRIGLTSHEAQTQLALIMSADMMYTYFFDVLFIPSRSRTALYGTLGIEAEFQ